MQVFIRNGVYFKASDVRAAKVAATKAGGESIVLKDVRGRIISTKTKGKWKDAE